MPMVKKPFNGQLNPADIYSINYNMIMNVLAFSDNIKDGFGLVNRFRSEGGLYGDSLLGVSYDVLETHDWLNDAEAANLLALDRPKDPKTQAITIDKARQIRVTTDEYLSKRQWMSLDSFSQFNAGIRGMVGNTKKVYDETIVNTFVGTTTTTDAKVNSVSITLPASPSGINDYALRGLKIGEGLADLFLDLKRFTRKYNGWGFMRNYNPEDFIAVWNGAYKNEIRKVDLPTVFHKDGIVDKLEEEVLPPEYFGDKIVDVTSTTYADATPTTTKPVKNASGTYTYEPVSGNTVKLCFAEECDAAVYDTTLSKYVLQHFFAGEEVPALTAIKGTFTVYKYDNHYVLSSGVSTAIDIKGLFFKIDDKVICKLVHKDSIKYLSAFVVSSSFWNPRSLTENNYNTFLYGLDHFIEFPIITIKEA